MKNYDVRKPLCLETDASGKGLCAALLQVREIPVVDMMKCQTIQCTGPLCLPARAYLVLSDDTAT